jgi:hypothetical protein
MASPSFFEDVLRADVTLDGKNIRHLVSPSGLLYLPTFLQLYHKQHLLAAALEPGYPAETEGRSLIMWIAWLLSGYRGDDDEPAELRDERLFVLRPYVFAPQQYELCYAPWTISYLPLGEGSSTSRLGNGIDPAEDANPFVADLKPKARTTRIQHFGQECEISPPILSHAAILRFFSKRKNQTSTAKLDMVAPMQQILSATGQDPIALDTLPSAVGASNDDAEEDDEDDDFGTIRDLISDSKLHDRDFARLKACHDPFTSRGMPRTNWHNSWNGCWEGTFSFFDFDSFREMLAGQSLALYEGPFGEQAQVWRMQETYVWRKSWAQKKEVERAKALEELQAKHREAKRARLERGEPEELSESEESTVAEGKGKEPQRGLPLTGPATNAGFPTDLPPSSSAGLATAEAEATTLKETIQQQVDSLEGYEAVPEHLLEEALAEEDGGEDAGLEMLLTGVGHSAWGRFILKGKVRVWDGMASLVKEYAVSDSDEQVWSVLTSCSPIPGANGSTEATCSRETCSSVDGEIPSRPRSMWVTKGHLSYTGGSRCLDLWLCTNRECTVTQTSV